MGLHEFLQIYTALETRSVSNNFADVCDFKRKEERKEGKKEKGGEEKETIH